MPKIRLFFHDRRKLLVTSLLVFILALGTFLRFYQLGASGDGNLYYAATVKSMLVSWHNFFFAAFEPGGSLSVDKPSLGFWMQAISAYFLGVNGFALALPNAISGVLSIFLVYKLVQRSFGTWAGLLAALVLAVMPVAISADWPSPKPSSNCMAGAFPLKTMLARGQRSGSNSPSRVGSLGWRGGKVLLPRNTQSPARMVRTRRWDGLSL